MTLAEFIDEKIAIAADYRNLDDINPVEIVTEDEYRNKYLILVSRFEPDAVTVPFNVSWINSDPEHKDYKTLQRRVDAESYDESGYRYVWSVLSTVEEIFNEPQFWKKAADPILGEIEQFGLGPATVDRVGAFRLTAETGDEATDASVSGTDPRMTDARVPTEHSHGISPVTMFSGGFAEVTDEDDVTTREQVRVFTSANAPTAGDIFVVTGISADGLSATGEWRKADNEIGYEGPRPTKLSILGPIDTIDSLTNHVLRANVDMDDGTTFISVQASWKVISNNQYGKVGSNTGVFQALEVDQERVVRVEASWTHPESGDVITNFIDITIRDASGVIRLLGIQILGPGEILKTETGTYKVQATFSDGSVTEVNPNAFTSSNPEAGNFVGGLLTPNPEQMFNKVTTLTATFTATGFTRTATLRVTVKDTNVYPDLATIVGAKTVDQNSTSDYTLSVHYTDGTTKTMPAKTWSMEDATYATISTGGRLTAKALSVPGDKSVVIKAVYEEGGVTLNASYPVTVKDNINYPVSARISGSTSVTAGKTSQYEMLVKYKDGTEVKKTPSLWKSSNTTTATIDAAGLMTAGSITASATVEISATYSELGVNLNPKLNVQVSVAAIPEIRYGTAKFANVNFTGGIIEPMTDEQIMYGVTNANTPQGEQYDHWAGVQDFFDTVLTERMPNTGGDTDLVLGVDEYLYIAYPSAITSLTFVDRTNSFPVELNGIAWADDIIVPPAEPTPPIMKITVMVDGESQVWNIQRTDFGGAMDAKYRVTANK